MIIRLAETNLKTKFGEYREILFYDGQKESFALVMGDVKDQADVLCRVHSSCIFAHHFNSIECDCREQMEISQQIIQKEGTGIIIWLEQEGKSNGHYALLKSIEHKKRGLSQPEAYEAAGFKKDARDFSPAAKILTDLGVTSITMLTNNPKKVANLSELGITVTDTQPTVL
ncbi:GTP cyclohydrolase [uncultured Aquimarina sp.]|uniref:GTP cyclohydrolase n=1 Tax=uncultured Aquimarina sp. TaxID=575652 RepID=UPI00262AEC8B|nr:GTP cyclohydrolase [uncultured Aquimarina sp.]